MDVYEEAVAFHERGEVKAAATRYERVLKSAPDHVGALHGLGTLRFQEGRFADAVALLRRAVAVGPKQHESWHVLGLALQQEEDLAGATRALEMAVKLFPTSPSLLNNLALVLKRRDLFDRALAALERALAADPDYVIGHYNRANCLRSMRRFDDAMGAYREVLARDPLHGDAHAALGEVLLDEGRAEEAIPSLIEAARRLPEDVTVVLSLGRAFAATGRPSESAAAYRHATTLTPGDATVWFRLGAALGNRDVPAAIAAYERCLALSPDDWKARHNFAQAAFSIGDVDTAHVQFVRALETKEDPLTLEALAVLIPGCPDADHDEVLQLRRRWAESLPSAPRPPAIARGDAPIRIGYLSSFFQDRNWMKPVWAVINHHDRSRVNVSLLSDAGRDAIEGGYVPHASDRYLDLSGLDNAAAADQIRALDLDVLVDLNGYSRMQRLPLLALRPAPVQVAWFNMYATTGMDSVDVLIGDPTVIAPDEERYYCEKIARVPHSYLAFRVGYPVPDVAALPWLANGYPTFGCLASLYKITPAVLDVWCRILGAVPSARLLLRNVGLKVEATRRHVLHSFSKRGVNPDRVDLLLPAEHREFLETYARIDLALDTFPYNGGTTTTEALWQGVPVICFRGDRWVARTSASLIAASHLHEMVADDEDGYIARAIALAEGSEGRDRLATLRRTLRDDLLSSPVCDVATLAHSLEAIYREAHEARIDH